ncbi:ATP-grasp domain-containing protein [Prevotella sp. RM4]|uniref:ATP-grasp domain-containing protein n=1 Tax=Prevotella sp. RM4 TaxID=1200547 RepID=UPI00068C8082|nr:ATP-grasp domain-containing protein [Prevotella sp. RM4]
MNILVTAIGSMSAECVLSKLKEMQHFVVGIDIYPKKWHYETSICDIFSQAPFAKNEKDYISFLLKTCLKYNIEYIIPLTDLEIDIINKNRTIFEEKRIILCMQRPEVLNIVRNKFRLHSFFLNDPLIPSLKTHLLSENDTQFTFPAIVKPYNGRSSEGLMLIKNELQISSIEHPENYIIQEYKDGYIYTVDYCRSSISQKDVAIPRRELLRTKNGAGLTIEIVSDKKLEQIASRIGNELNINGCVNMEFIYNNKKYYLIDINPRFSAGIAFSVISGYDMIKNHLNCFIDKDIDSKPQIKKGIIIKKYTEVTI